MKARGWKVGILVAIVAVFVAVAFSVRRCASDPSDWEEPEVGTDELEELPLVPPPDELPPDQYDGSGDEEFDGPEGDVYPGGNEPDRPEPI
ncbi:MAG: hypothetical protein KDD51_04815 [Bdellovibrionales bacterium]|nr:hypothetical protein [Bdellovibrionales bacterium]